MNNLLLYLFFYLSVAYSINNTILEGYVYDSNLNPLYNVEVYIEDASLGTITDTSGYFQIIIPYLFEKQFDYTLTISHIGYISKKVAISNSKAIKVYLEKKLLNSDEIVVTALGYKSHIKDTPVITHIVTGKDIYNSSYNSISEIIEFVMPNVQKVHDPHGTDGKLKIQGLDNRFVVFMIDGNRISGEFAGNIDLSLINIDDIERIEIIRSGMSTLYGSDSMGGVINIITKKNKSTASANISYNWDLPVNESLSLSIGARFYNFDYKLSLNYNNSPGYDLTAESSPLNKTVEENLNYKISNSISYKWEDIVINYMNQYYAKEVNLYNYRAEYEIDGFPNVVDGLLSDNENSRYKDYMNSFSISYKNFKLNLSKELYDKSIYYPYYYNTYPNNKDGATITTANPARYDISVSLNAPVQTHYFLFGIQFSKETYQSYDVYNQNETEILTPSIFSDNKVKVIDEYSFVITDKFRILSLEMVLGLRSTKYSSYNTHFIPSLSVRYEDLNNKNILFNYSKGYRVPSIKELYYSFPEHPMQPLYGNSELKPSISDYYAVSIENSNSSIEFYINNVLDMISPVSTSDGIMQYMNINKISLSGFNINFDTSLFDKFTIKSMFSITEGRSNDKKLLEGISKYSFNMRIKYDMLRNMSLLVMTKYNSDKKVFVYNQGGSAEGNFYPLESYWVLDLLTTFKYKKISIKSGVKNIFNYLSPTNTGENLSTIDPGRRFYLSTNFSI